MNFRTGVLKYSIAVLLLLAITIGSASAAGYVYISPESPEGLSPGDTFTLSIIVDSQGNDLTAIGVSLNYDQNALKVTGLTEEGAFGTKMLVGPGSGDDGQGAIKYEIAAVGDTHQVSDEKFLTIEFQVKTDSEDGTYPVSFEEVRLIDENRNDISGEATGAFVLIGDASVEDTEVPETIGLGDVEKSATIPTTTSTLESTAESQLEYEYVFGFHPEDYHVVSQRGSSNIQEGNKADMLMLESKLNTNFENELFYPRGKIISLGTNSAGSLVVIFYEPLVEQSDIDGIYAIIDGEAKTMGIDDVPVEFGSGTGSQVSDVLHDLIGNVKTMNGISLASLADDKSSVYDPSVIGTAGQIPEIENEKESWQWFFQDSYRISLDTEDELEPYILSGIIVSTGVSSNGYFEVRINENADIDRSTIISDIYEIIDAKAQNIGISDVPVVFKLSTLKDDDLGSLQEQGAENMYDAESEAKETPGFGFIAGLMSMSMVYCLRRFSTRSR
ncbi:cohesin domain-containing protein [Methanolobus sp. ZRKC3]|uniref:cohesin domain-containing protein n=1 Tax=Methanolobus sp. ZRKC3 TaxID=3125786 RepID=UPI00324EDBB7